jgi:hypothetical protein
MRSKRKKGKRKTRSKITRVYKRTRKLAYKRTRKGTRKRTRKGTRKRAYKRIRKRKYKRKQWGGNMSEYNPLINHNKKPGSTSVPDQNSVLNPDQNSYPVLKPDQKPDRGSKLPSFVKDIMESLKKLNIEYENLLFTQVKLIELEKRLTKLYNDTQGKVAISVISIVPGIGPAIALLIKFKLLNDEFKKIEREYKVDLGSVVLKVAKEKFPISLPISLRATCEE